MERHDENISHDESRVAELVSSLRHVDAPADFNAQVRSRINARGERRRSFTWTPILASTVALIVIASGVFLGVRMWRPAGAENNVAVVNSTERSAPTAAAPSLQETVPAAIQSPELVASTKQPTATPALRPNKNGGGSVDEALSEGKKFFPRGVDPRNSNVSDTRGVGGNSQMPVTGILGGLGIDASWNGGGWQVNSVAKGSLPERSGLRIGDVIESIDGKPLAEKTVVTGTFSTRSLRVLRDGKAVEVPLRP